MTRAATYYKATTPDGRDFRSGTVDYAGALASGEPVTHPRSRRFGDMRPNDPGTYLSVSVEPGETLLGGSWSCRLFRVEPVGRTVRRTDGRWPHKRGCRALRVVEELPAYVALGPNGEQVAALIERVRRLTYNEARDLAAARGAACDEAWDAAWGAAWDEAWDAARGAAGDAAWAVARDAARGAAWGAARDAARDAAIALVVRDLVTPERFDALYGPWRRVVKAEPRPNRYPTKPAA